MYRIHNQTNSPYQIDTRKGVTIVPAYGSVIADLTDDQRVFLEGYPDYRIEPVSYESPAAVKDSFTAETWAHTRHDPADTADSERDQIIAELTERGIEFDGRMGAKKLRKLLDAANR